LPPNKPPSAFDNVSDYTKRVVVQSHDVLYNWDSSHHIADACVMLHTYQAHLAGTTHTLTEHCNTEAITLTNQPCLYESHAHEVNKHPPDYQSLQPMFGWLPANLIKQTFKVTTQYAQLPMSILLKKQYKLLMTQPATLGTHHQASPKCEPQGSQMALNRQK